MAISLFGFVRCPTCKLFKRSVKRRRMDTAYVDEESNFCCECADCFEITQEYWAERWADYYGGFGV